MPVESIGAPVDQASAVSRRAGLQQEDFLQILLAQLRFQDPLKPLDNNEFMAQFAQLTNLEQTQQFNEKLDTLLSLQSTNQAVGLLGKTVEVRTDNESVVGEVISTSFQSGRPVLSVETSDGAFLTDIALGQIVTVR